MTRLLMHSARKHGDDVIAAALMNATIGPGRLAVRLVAAGSHFCDTLNQSAVAAGVVFDTLGQTSRNLFDVEVSRSSA